MIVIVVVALNIDVFFVTLILILKILIISS